MCALTPGWTVVVLVAAMIVVLLMTSIITSSVERVRIARYTGTADPDRGTADNGDA